MKLTKLSLIQKKVIVHSGYCLEEIFQNASTKDIIQGKKIHILKEPPIILNKDEIFDGNKIRPYIKKEIDFDANICLLGRKIWGEKYYYPASYGKLED